MTSNNRITIALVQSNIEWENPEGNFLNLNKLIQHTSADVIVLPEMFSTGFSMHSENISETLKGASFNWMQKTAKQKNAAIIGSIPTKENNQFFNRLFWVNPDGSYHQYDKRHLFRMANEDQSYTQGEKRLIVNFRGVRFCPMVCYDLRFPVWSRNKNDYDCLIYIANWPEVRVSAWDNLIKSRAIENLSYSIGVNRVGKDGNGINYSGNSVALDFKGSEIIRCIDHKESVQTFEINMDQLTSFRNKFPAHLDADLFEVLN